MIKLNQTQTSHDTIGNIYDTVDKSYKPGYRITKLWNVTEQKLAKQFERLVTVRGLLYRKINTKGLTVYQTVLPQCSKDLVLEHLHNENVHQGIERTTHLILPWYYLPNVVQTVKSRKKCNICTVSKPESPQPKSMHGQ